MGVYIDMEMPKTYPMTVTIYPDGQVLSETVGAKDKHGIAVPVPEPHGRLGDLDELHKEAVRRSEKAGTYDSWYNCADRVISAFDIANARTIIPASEEEKS